MCRGCCALLITFLSPAATLGTGLQLSRSYDFSLRAKGNADIENAVDSPSASATLTIAARCLERLPQGAGSS